MSDLTLSPPPGCAPFRYPSDPLQFIAWRDFVVWAVADSGMREAFEAFSGRRFLPPPRDRFEAALDAIGGLSDHQNRTLVAFIEWVNDAHWGADMVSWQPLPAAEPADAR